MTLAELKAKAELHGATLLTLAPYDSLKEGDYIEWSKDAYTTIEKGSPFIGRSLGDGRGPDGCSPYITATSAYRLVEAT
jgi:hypothetical protein